MNFPVRRWIVLLLGLHSLILTPKVFAQFGGPFGPYLTLTGVQITNVSGMCYSTFTFTNTSQFCVVVTNTPVVRNDTNLYTSFTVAAIPGCFVSTDPGIPRPPVIDTMVLGALEPGQYQLVYDVSYGGPVNSMLLTIPGPAANTKMLTLSQTNGGLNLSVDGLANVRYIIESSCDFTNWTSIQTNTGAPFTSTIPTPTNAFSYYRVQVQATP